MYAARPFRPALALAVVLLAGETAYLLLRQTLSPGEPQVSGAYGALAMWGLERAYPSGRLPSAGLTAAFAQRQALAARETADGTAWEPMGPTNVGGRTLALVVNPLRPETVWAGSASGGLWRSYDSGDNASWERLTTGFPVTAASALALARTDTSTLYLGTGEVYRYQDTRGGVVDRLTRGSYGIGILKSTDGGATWSHVLDWSQNQERGVQAIAVNPSDADDVWAATTEGVYRSTDGGQTWTNVHPVVMATSLVLHPTDPDWAVAAHGNQESEGKGLYRTTDGGATWEQLTDGVPDDFIGKIILDRHPTDPDLLYASVGNGIDLAEPTSTTLLRTLDGGDTWQTVTTENYATYQGWYSHYVAVHPLRPDTLFLGGVSLRRYQVSSNTLTSLFPGAGDQHAIAFHPTDPDVVYFANDGGVHRTITGGDATDNLSTGYQTLQFYNGTGHARTDAQSVIGGSQDNGSWLWAGSEKWRKVCCADGTWSTIDPTNVNIQYSSSQYLYLHRTTDRWGSLVEITPPDPGDDRTAFNAPHLPAPSLPTRLYAGRNIIYRSDDRGDSWTATNGGQPLDDNVAVAMAVSETDLDVVYVTTAPNRLPTARGGEPPGVFVTRDGGTTWTNITGTLPDRILPDLAVDPTDDRTVYVTASGFGTGHVFKTTDGGQTWTDLTGDLPDAPTSAVTVDPSNPAFLAVGNDVGVFVSFDGGATWQSFNTGLPEAVQVSDLQVSPLDRTLRVATHGNGMYRRSLRFDGPVAVEPETTPEGFALEPVAPNPVRGTATFTFQLNETGPARLALHDVRGRRLAVLAEGVRTAGRHTVRLDARRLPSGSYLVRLEVGGQTATRRLVLVR